MYTLPLKKRGSKGSHALGAAARIALFYLVDPPLKTGDLFKRGIYFYLSAQRMSHRINL